MGRGSGYRSEEVGFRECVMSEDRPFSLQFLLFAVFSFGGLVRCLHGFAFWISNFEFLISNFPIPFGSQSNHLRSASVASRGQLF